MQYIKKGAVPSLELSDLILEEIDNIIEEKQSEYRIHKNSEKITFSSLKELKKSQYFDTDTTKVEIDIKNNITSGIRISIVIELDWLSNGYYEITSYDEGALKEVERKIITIFNKFKNSYQPIFYPFKSYPNAFINTVVILVSFLAAYFIQPVFFKEYNKTVLIFQSIFLWFYPFLVIKSYIKYAYPYYQFFSIEKKPFKNIVRKVVTFVILFAFTLISDNVREFILKIIK